MIRRSFATEEILITVKAYPNPSQKYIEASCTAGLTRDREWLRIYPVTFRMLENDRQFRKYQWIRARIKKASDSRPESHKIDLNSIEILDEALSTEEAWAKRRDFLEPVRKRSMEDIWEEQERNGTSLAFFKPKLVKRLITEPTTEEWTDAQLAALHQQSFLLNGDTAPLQKIPYNFKYEFYCDDERCNGHICKIVDWEIHQSYRAWKRQYGPDGWEEKLRHRYEFEMREKKDTHFFMGNMMAHPKSWIVIGLFYPPKRPGIQMSLQMFDS